MRETTLSKEAFPDADVPTLLRIAQAFRPTTIIWTSFEEIRYPVAPWQRLTAFSVMDQLTERALLNRSDLLKAFAA
jgi:hypothetical protein